MNKELLVKEIAVRAGLRADRTGADCAPMGSVGFLPQGLDRTTARAVQSLGIYAPGRAPELDIERGELFAPLGSRTAARRFLRGLKRLAAYQEYLPGAELSLVGPGQGIVQVVGQGFSTEELDAVIAGQI